MVNLTGNRRAVFWAAWACFFAGTAWLGGLVTGLVSPGVPPPTGWLCFTTYEVPQQHWQSSLAVGAVQHVPSICGAALQGLSWLLLSGRTSAVLLRHMFDQAVCCCRGCKGTPGLQRCWGQPSARATSTRGPRSGGRCSMCRAMPRFDWRCHAVHCTGCTMADPFQGTKSACACRLSYKGLGEPLCFMAFGPLALGAFYLAQVSTHHCDLQKQWWSYVWKSYSVTAMPVAS